MLIEWLSAGPVRWVLIERRDAAVLDEADPGHDVFRPVLHQERDDVALAQALSLRPAREAVGAGIELGIGDDAVFVEHGRAVRLLPRPAFEPIGDGELGGWVHGARHRERARDGGDIDRFPVHRIG